jgi:hypothetical protein
MDVGLAILSHALIDYFPCPDKPNQIPSVTWKGVVHVKT